jgi:hypothetical protein
VTLEIKKLDEEKFGSSKWFRPAFLHNLLRLVKGTAKLNTCPEEECNKYDLTAASCF